jgi:hypothetical protein
MSIYTRSKTTNFPNGIIPNELFEQIIDIITSPILTNINIEGDDVHLIFDSELPDEIELDSIISNYTPTILEYSVPYLKNNIMKNVINGNEYNYYGNHPARITISTTSQADFTSIKSAILANNTPNNIFVVFPGTYVEDNPIVLPNGSTLISEGSVSNTIIVAANPTQNLLVMGRRCKIFGITSYGAYGPDAVGMYFDGSLSGGQGDIGIVGECFFIDCNVSIECNGNDSAGMSDTLYCDKIVIVAQSHALSKAVYCHGGGQFITTVCYIVGVPGYYPFTYGVYCTGTGSKVSLCTTSVWFSGTALYLNDNASAEISLLAMRYNNIGVQIGDTGILTRLSANSLAFQDSITYDLSVIASSASIEIHSSHMDDAKVYNPNKINMAIKYISFKYGSYYQSILGDTQIGSPTEPSKLAIGEGLYVNNGVAIFSNNNLEVGTWIDNTNSALNIVSDGFNLFQSVDVDNCLYFGSNIDIFGFKINIVEPTLSITPLNDIIWEFWNGTTWVEFYVMQTYPDYPCNTYINSFVSIESKFHIRFGLTSTAPFALKTLNGISKKWIRLRVVNVLSSIPTGEYVKIHTNATLINTDGFIEYFGNARSVKQFPINFTYLSDTTLEDQDLYITPTINISPKNNVFSAGVLSRIGFRFKMPIEIDTSFPIKINLAFVCNNVNAGNIEWKIRYTYTTNGNDMFLNSTDADASSANVITTTKITVVGSNQNNKDLRDTISMAIHTIPGNPSTNNKYILFASLERDAVVSNTNDTYPGDVAIHMMDGVYVTWLQGGHILGY